MHPAAAACLPRAQMQRWWVNWPGKTTVKHLALQLQAMEQLRAQQRAAQAGAQPQQQQAQQGDRLETSSGGSRP